MNQTSTPFQIENTDENLVLYISKNSSRRGELIVLITFMQVLFFAIFWYGYQSDRQAETTLYFFTTIGPIWIFISLVSLWLYFVKAAAKTVYFSNGIIVHITHTFLGDWKKETHFHCINTMRIEEIRGRSGIYRFISMTYDATKKIRIAEDFSLNELQKLINELQILRKGYF